VTTRKLDLDRYRAALMFQTAEIPSATSPEDSQRLLREVEYALWRMERGRYGACLKCEDDIEQTRLDAQPSALFCVNCQYAVDLLQEGARARRNQSRKAAAA
jgi:RNA polymerase-binding transcription factor DksA